MIRSLYLSYFIPIRARVFYRLSAIRHIKMFVQDEYDCKFDGDESFSMHVYMLNLGKLCFGGVDYEDPPR